MQQQPRVYVGFVTRSANPTLAEITHASAAVEYANKNGVFAILRHVPSSYGVAIGRNQVAREMFDAKCDDPFTHLMFIDDDVTIPPDAVHRLATSGKDIICGQIPSIHILSNLEVPYVQCMNMDGTWPHRWLPPSDEPVRIKGCGFGCIMIRREVLESLGFPWFVWPDEDRHKRARMSEDVHFCFRAAAAGWEIYADSLIRCGHHKTLDVASQIVESWDRPHDVTWQGPKTSKDLDGIAQYATHVPALIAVGKRHKIRHIVEFGGGCWSTPLFCNRSVFPDAERITTYESNSEWLARLRKQYPDPRLELIYRDLPSMPAVPANGADLVFVDSEADCMDPADFTTRKKILLHQASTGCIAVIHDSDHLAADTEYWQQFKHVRTYTPPSGFPCTAIVSQSIPLDDLVFEDIGGLAIKKLTRNS